MMHAGLILTAIVFPVTAIAQQPTIVVNPFRDIAPQHPFYDAIVTLASRRIITGYPDGSYKPSQTINRAEFLKIIVEANADRNVIETCLLSATGTGALFRDTPAEQWYAKYVCVAKSHRMIFGYPDGTFRPAQPINLVEAATILARNFRLLLEPPPGSIWYKPFLDEILTRNAVPYTVQSLQHLLTRSEMAEMVWRLTDQVTTKDSPTYEELTGLRGQD